MNARAVWKAPEQSSEQTKASLQLDTYGLSYCIFSYAIIVISRFL
jgi:hypothetical protein